MSNERRVRAEAEFFVYERGVVVPRDVTHVLVSPSIKVLPEGVFRGLIYLKEVVLTEGLREIGESALRGCSLLEHISFPSTLVRIGNLAFHGCTSLTTLHFPEGLVDIGQQAFCYCTSLNYIVISSTVESIGRSAFQDCSLLKEVMFVDGIRTIGAFAFYQCAVEDMILPATLIEIGRGAFGFCRSLRRVKVLGGIQLIEGRAFNECDLLSHIMVTPKCVVVEKIGEVYNFEFAKDGMIVPNTDLERVLITSECFHSMSSEELSTLGIAITQVLEIQLGWADQILGTQLHRGWDNKCKRLRALLAPHERRRKEEVTTILEIGLLKAEMPCVIVKNVLAFL